MSGRLPGALAHLLDGALERAVTPVESLAGERLLPAEMRAAAARVEAALREAGLRPDEPVLVAMGNRPIDLAALLGAWRAGAVAVPVHVSAAAATLDAVRGATQARFSVDGTSVIGAASAAPPDRPLLRGAALVIFTSGTTGRPKGVVIGHDRMAAKLDVLDRLLGLRPGDEVVVPLQLTFIFGLWVSLLTLRSGAHLQLAPRFSAEGLAPALARASVLAAVPTMLRALVASGESGPGPRMVLTGGEALSGALAQAVAARFPGTNLYDLYGLTETGSCDFCLGPDARARGGAGLGEPTEGVEFRIAVEPGEEAGELQIRTPFGMLGFLDAEALTAAAYADDYFRTGDLARRRSDGGVELVGRSKEIISRGGNKVAPLELDDLLAEHPDVAGALCAGVPDERLGEAIHAVVVLREGARLTSDELRAWAAARIERYKLPDAIHVRASLPVGSTGKASRAALAEMVASGEA